MVGLSALFWVFVILFAMIGMMRGWARELLVTFSFLVALFLVVLLEKFSPFVRDALAVDSDTGLFWLRSCILACLVFFGYQTPNIPRLAESGRFTRTTLQDALLGLFIGAINGFLVFGSLWSYLDKAGYPFPIITAPEAGTPAGDAARLLLPILPPIWITAPAIYFAVAAAFVIMLVVFL